MVDTPLFYEGKGNWSSTAANGGSEQSVIACPFGFDTPDLAAGALAYTPTVGDVLIDAWVEIDTAWDGTTPKGDFGAFISNGYGLFASANNFQALNMLTNDAQDTPGVGTVAGSQLRSLRDLWLLNYLVNAATVADGAIAVPGVGGGATMPFKFDTADPIKIVVSQDGHPGGDDPASTTGSATLYLVIATPVASS